jgi:hypothetical protein
VNAPVPLFSSLLLGGAEIVAPSAAPAADVKPPAAAEANPSAAQETKPPVVDTKNDGRWEAREWFASAGRVKVLIAPDSSSLSASGSGGAMDALAWAAAAAGIPSIVLGRWPAEGFLSDTLLTTFDEQLAKGVSTNEAWAVAVKAARKDAPGPAAWTGLRLIGR